MGVLGGRKMSRRTVKLKLFLILGLRTVIKQPGNAKGGSSTVPLTSYLTGLD